MPAFWFVLKTALRTFCTDLSMNVSSDWESRSAIAEVQQADNAQSLERNPLFRHKLDSGHSYSSRRRYIHRKLKKADAPTAYSMCDWASRSAITEVQQADNAQSLREKPILDINYWSYVLSSKNKTRRLTIRRLLKSSRRRFTSLNLGDATRRFSVKPTSMKLRLREERTWWVQWRSPRCGKNETAQRLDGQSSVRDAVHLVVGWS